MSASISRIYSKVLSSNRLSRLRKLAQRIKETPRADAAKRQAILIQAQSDRSERTLVEVFALARDAVEDVTGLRLHESQIIGGLALTNRQVAEMKTGEGKTLTLVAPVVWAALEGKGVHVVTANPYLAERDCADLSPIYAALGLSAGFIYQDMPEEERMAAYACDITYGVNSEFGFDYLRDLRRASSHERVQRTLHVAFIDELDAILIDDARTPLILSGPAQDFSHEYRCVFEAVSRLSPGIDFIVDESAHGAVLTDSGYAKVEPLLVSDGLIGTASDLYQAEHAFLAKALNHAASARSVYRRGRDYLVQNGEVVLLDASTGRTMSGRRLEDGLHEMLEIKEDVSVQAGTHVIGTVTYQNYFSLYERICGLTGTAFTEAEELLDVYGLEVVIIPTHRPVARVLHDDVLCESRTQKAQETLAIAHALQSTGQPLLIGTGSVRDAHYVHDYLAQHGVSANLLTAEDVEKEASLVAQAGRKGAVTVATSVAGRGTDILLGGKGASPEERAEVAALGGLYVLGFERNGLRRVDLQLLGRSARQGDPGEAKFLVSLEDDLVRSFASNSSFTRAYESMGQGRALGGKLVSRLIAQAQASVERAGYEARRQLQQFDNVLSEQRIHFFDWRWGWSESDELAKSEFVARSAQGIRRLITEMVGAEQDPAKWPLLDLKRQLERRGMKAAPVMAWAKNEMTIPEICQACELLLAESLAQHETPWFRQTMLKVTDSAWVQHLSAMNELTKSVGLASKIGKNPSLEFALRSGSAFAELLSFIDDSLLIEVGGGTRDESKPGNTPRERVLRAHDERWITRNEACPCGSGKRFKHCHGRVR